MPSLLEWKCLGSAHMTGHSESDPVQLALMSFNFSWPPCLGRRKRMANVTLTVISIRNLGIVPTFIAIA